jgi:hypothetical protein
MSPQTPTSRSARNPYASGVVVLALLLGALLLTLGLTSPARASNAFAEDRVFRVDVTGIQVVDWRARTSWPLDDLAGWTTQDGSQTLGWHTRRTGTLNGTRYLRRRVGDVVLPPFVLAGAGRALRIEGTVERRSAVRSRDPTPVCEGGTLDDDCLVVPFPRSVPQTCGRRSIPVGVVVSPSGEENEDLVVTTAAAPDRRYPACGPSGGVMGLRPPTSGTGRSPDADLDVAFRNVARRVGRVRRGGRLKLERELRLGCPMPAIRPGVVDSCTTTHVTVELTRIR